MTGRNIARYIRVNQLSQPLKERLNDGSLPLVAAVDLSYLSDGEQNVVSELAEQGRIKLDGKITRAIKDMEGEVTADRILEFAGNKKQKKADADKNVKLSADVYERYFADTKPGDVAGIVEEALAAWFEGREMTGVS